MAKAIAFIGFLLLSVGALAQPAMLAITHVTVIDATGAAPRPDVTVLVSDARVSAIGREVRIPEKATVVPGAGKFLIPGLWDMHVHWNDERYLALFIANGVTGIRVMWGYPRHLDQRRRIAEGSLVGPRMAIAGTIIDGPKPWWPDSIAAGTPEEGREAVRRTQKDGYDYVKVYSGLPREVFFAIADEAKKLGIPFEGHVPDAIRASEAIAAGQRTFEHLIGIFEASSPDEDAYITDKYDGGTKRPGVFLKTYDPRREERIIRQIAAARTWQCPTLFWERGQWLVDIVDVMSDPDLPYAAKRWVSSWPKARASILKGLASDPRPIREAFVAHELDIVRKLHAAHVPFLAGTDTPAGVDVLPGISLHLELQRFVAAGFTPLEALQTATLNPAMFYNRTGDYGSVQPGRLADLVMLEANPLTDIRNTRTITGVVADGRYLSSADLDTLRATLRQRAARR